MATLTLALSLGAALAVALPPAELDAEKAAGPELVLDELAFQAHADWELRLPDEKWKSVGGGIDLDGFEFRVDKTGAAKIAVDTDGDGKTDTDVKGVGGFLVLEAEDADGREIEYAVRLHNDGNMWQWSTSGTLSGRVRGEQVHLIDQNGNGRYDDFGDDAMLVGRRSQTAFFLSRVVNLGGDLYELELDGTTVTTRPYAGETARIEVESGWEGKGKLTTAVFADRRSKISFDPVGTKGGLLVPAGTYRFMSGMAERQGESAQMGSGRLAPVELAAGDERSLEWGGPVTMLFDYHVRKDQITVGANVRFYGSSGEEYHSFQPNAKSPKILVYDKKTGKLVESGRFGGC